jgi:peptide/nickel transport system ATP-binding protein
MVQMSAKELRALRRRELSVVMQSAMNAPNPVKSIGAQLSGTMRAHQRTRKEAILERSRQVLRLVGIDPVYPCTRLLFSAVPGPWPGLGRGRGCRWT